MQQNLLKHTLGENTIRMVKITFQLSTSTNIALAPRELLHEASERQDVPSYQKKLEERTSPSCIVRELYVPLIPLSHSVLRF